MVTIPRDVAIQICEKIREEHDKKIYMVGQMQCAACIESSKGDPDKMCFASTKENRGCIYVNKRFDMGRH